jgi:hypothetical protein
MLGEKPCGALWQRRQNAQRGRRFGTCEGREKEYDLA